ncbi:MAG: Hpt domain-containing protein, partial [Candidatus Heimdallarchaeota archaeon]|nr:Hpt domain-containing protein [Candidatus Heimdallarchaeota archaeon]
MQDRNRLTELIEQAACSTNMLSPTDFSEIDKLQALLNEINEAIAEISDCPEKLFKKAKASNSKAAKQLEKLLKNDVEDTNKSIELVSKAVTVLQDIIEQINQEPEDVTDDQTPETDDQTSEANNAQNNETESQGEFVIPEEDAPLILDFIAESNEHIESAESGLLELESKPDDDEVLNQIFRAFHTIKGMAGFLNLTDIGSLAHSAENLLDLARKGELVLVGENMDVIFESVDMLKKMILGLKESVEAGNAVPLQKQLPELLAKLKATIEGQSFATSLDTPQGQEKDKKLDEILVVKNEPTIIENEPFPDQDRRRDQDRRSGTERRTSTV